MPKKFLNGGSKRPEKQRVAGVEIRWKRAIFRARAKIAFSKHDRGKAANIARVKRAAPRKPDFDRASGGNVPACEAGGQRRGVVCHNQVSGAHDEVHKTRARDMAQYAAPAHRQQLRLR